MPGDPLYNHVIDLAGFGLDNDLDYDVDAMCNAVDEHPYDASQGIYWELEWDAYSFDCKYSPVEGYYAPVDWSVWGKKYRH